MKFSAREDVNVPIDNVFAAVTDFDYFERQIIRRGAEVHRSDPTAAPQEGTVWNVTFKFRGRPRTVRATVDRMEHPNLLQIGLKSDGLDGVTLIELLPLSKVKTRMSVSIELSARTLTARLLLQSLKLAKANLTSRFKKRVSEFAERLESQTKPTRS